MQIHTIHPKTKMREARRIGRGGKRGTYSGRGIKGQGARAGGKFRPQEREIIKRIPKLRGFKFKSFQLRPAIVNIGRIEAKFKEGSTVSPRTLREAGLVSKIKGRMPQVKILGKGSMKKKMIFQDVIFSGTLKNMAEKPEEKKEEKKKIKKTT